MFSAISTSFYVDIFSFLSFFEQNDSLEPFPSSKSIQICHPPYFTINICFPCDLAINSSFYGVYFWFPYLLFVKWFRRNHFHHRKACKYVLRFNLPSTNILWCFAVSIFALHPINTSILPPLHQNHTYSCLWSWRAHWAWWTGSYIPVHVPNQPLNQTCRREIPAFK